MSDEILRNMTSQFNISTDGPYPLDIASDQLWDLISHQDSHSEDTSIIEAGHENRAVNAEDHDSDGYSLEVPSHLLGPGDSPSTDSGMSLIVNLGTARYADGLDAFFKSKGLTDDSLAPGVSTIR